jgi:PKD repeat protein
MQSRYLVLALALAVLPGCIAPDSMQDLKHSLGVEPALPPAPVAKAAVDTPEANVGQVLHFTALESRDAPGIELQYLWSFGDGTAASGANASHAYASAGVFPITLTVQNPAGLTDTSVVHVKIDALARPPIPEASFSPSVAWVGAPVAFSASGSTDPDGRTFRTLWDFGDGVQSSDSNPSHPFAAPGDHVVTLTLVDAAGEQGQTTLVVPVSYAVNATGTLDLAHASTNLTLPVPQPGGRVEVVLQYDATPPNSVALALYDTAGQLVAQAPSGGGSATPTAPPNPLDPSPFASLTLGTPVGSHPVGSWTLSVLLREGARVPYSLEAQVLYGS